MIFILLFLGCLLIGVVLSKFTPIWVPTTACAVVFTGLVVYAEFHMPREGGGASMWPIALLFGVPLTSSGAYVGWKLAHKGFFT